MVDTALLGLRRLVVLIVLTILVGLATFVALRLLGLTAATHAEEIEVAELIAQANDPVL